MKRRYEWRRFDWTEPEAIEAHLSRMAARGWQLERIGSLLWRYAAAPPQECTYAVAYSCGDTSVYDGTPTESQLEYRDYCEAAGWRFVAGLACLQVFRADRQDAAPLETDEAVKLASVGRTLRRNFLPAQVFLLAFLLLLAALLVPQLLCRPYEFLRSHTSLLLLLLFPLMLLESVTALLHVWLWYWKSKRSVAAGGRCARLSRRFRRGRQAALVAALLLLLLAMAADFCTGDPGIRAEIAYILLKIVLVLALAWELLPLLRRLGWDRGAVGSVYWGAVVVLAVVLVVISPDTSERNRVTRAALPLSMEDLGWAAEGTEPYARLSYSRSPLLSFLEGLDWDDGWLRYRVYRSPWPYLLSCTASALHRGLGWVEITGDPAWRGGRVWRLPGVADPTYCAAYPGVVLYIDYGLPPTPAQIGMTLDALLP